MKNTAIIPRSLVAIAFLCFASAAFGQDVPFGITAKPTVLDGVHTDPYNALVNGTPIVAFCDDFTDEVTPGQNWSTLATNLSQFPSTSLPVSTVYFKTGTGATQTQDYIAAAILASEALQSSTSNRGMTDDISFALWGVFDPTLLPQNDAGLSSADLTAAKGFLSSALAVAARYQTGAAYEQATGDIVEIYSATRGKKSEILQTGKSRPQEFITVVSMDEPPSPAILGLDFLGLGILVVFFRRRAAHAAK
jgi:hypothetical protein